MLLFSAEVLHWDISGNHALMLDGGCNEERGGVLTDWDLSIRLNRPEPQTIRVLDNITEQ